MENVKRRCEFDFTSQRFISWEQGCRTMQNNICVGTCRHLWPGADRFINLSEEKNQQQRNCRFHHAEPCTGWWWVNSLLSFLVFCPCELHRCAQHAISVLIKLNGVLEDTCVTRNPHPPPSTSSFHLLLPLNLIFMYLKWTASLESGRVLSRPLQPLRP